MTGVQTCALPICSPRTEKGALDILRNKKSEIDGVVNKIYGIETEVERLHEEYHRMRSQLKEIKDQHASETPDMDKITKAVETVSLHNEVKNYVADINRCDEDLADAAYRAKRIRRPATILFILLLCLVALCAAAVIFSSRLQGISFLQNFAFYQKALSRKMLSYVVCGGAAVFLTIVYIIVASCGGGRIRNLKEELFELEEELSELLNTEYIYGAKHHSFNRDNINAALEKHTEEYKCARAILDNENNKNNIDREYLASVEEYTQKIASTKASADALNKTADELGDSEDLSAQSAELSEQIDSYNRRLECLALAKKGLEEAYQRWQADLGPVFGNEAGILLGRLTNGRYHDLRVARNFEITLRSEEGTMYHSYNYSGATIDQMYLALRLALVKIISVSESMLPLILDDPFVQYDAIRKQYAYDVIEQFSAENHAQIILTVCRSEAFPESFRVTELQNV